MLDGMGNINKMTGQTPESSEMKPLSQESFNKEASPKENLLHKLQLVAKDKATYNQAYIDLHFK